MTVDEFINVVRNQSQPEELDQFTIDQFSDDELYVTDMQAKFPDLTEEEILNSLEHDKSNSALFDKKMNNLRNEYKELERLKIEQELAEQEAAFQEQQEIFQNSVVEALNNINTSTIGGFQLDLSDNDMQGIYDFLTQTDRGNVRYLAKALNDPNTLVKMAWFAIKGDEALQDIKNYYSREISSVAKTNYEKGLLDGKKQQSGTLFVTNNKNNNKSTGGVKSHSTLFKDDF